MFTLYEGREIEWELSPEDFAYICSPEHALEQSKTHYDLDERNYRSKFSPFSVPERLYSRQPTWRRAQAGYVDPIYDSIKEHLQLGWLIGVDTTEQWNWVENPFYVDENGELICDSPDYYHEWFIREITDGYNDAVANRNGLKAEPTQKFHYGSSYSQPEQHAQAAKTLNSKAAGRLLAAGGVYNGNIEGYAKTAQQLGGDAPAGYVQVLNETTAGSAIALASIGAAFGLGRLGSMQEIESIEKIYGARGPSSLREFDPDLAGGPLEKLSTEGVNITHAGVDTVELHISRFEPDIANDFMIDRLRKISDGTLAPESVDLNYFTHECREFQRYCNLGWESGQPTDGVAAYDLWNNAHTATLEEFGLRDNQLYHPDAFK